MEDWIKYSDRLPESGVPVLCNFKHWHANKDRQDVLVRVEEDDCLWRVWDLGEYQDELSHEFNVTHWMPLPAPPE